MSNNNCNICSNNCFGRTDYGGSCCTIEDRDFIVGPHSDSDSFIERLKLKIGLEIKKEDVFVEYEEGRAMFPEKSVWQRMESYPAMRVDTSHPRKPCIFFNTRFRYCTVYDIRPKTCIDYECDFLKNAKKISFV